VLKHFTEALFAIGPVGVLVLAFLDSTGIPVAAGMDALLIFLAVQSPQVAWVSAAFAVLGSTAGNLILFTAAQRGGRRFLEKSARPGRSKRFAEWFRRYGLLTVFIPALIPFPLPMKLFVVCAGALATSRRAFLLVVVLARVLRYCGDVWLGLSLGRGSVAFLTSHVWYFAGAGLLLFVILYAILRWGRPQSVEIGPGNIAETGLN